MILITGASGNVGGETLKQAVAAGLPVRAAQRGLTAATKSPATAVRPRARAT
jgi:uncharacterized protein YbjT (DUF2867 family)